MVDGQQNIAQLSRKSCCICAGKLQAQRLHTWLDCE